MQIERERVVLQVQSICKSGDLDTSGAALDERVSDLVWGWQVDAKVDRHAPTFYRLTVDNRHAEDGFLLLCKSANKDRFKIGIFDCSSGEVVYSENSIVTKVSQIFGNVSHTSAFFTRFKAFKPFLKGVGHGPNKSF